MLSPLNLKQIEKKAYRSIYNDGLYDISWGLLLLGFGLSPLLKDVGFPKPFDLFLMPLAALLILFLGKKYLTVPRLGIVRFRDNHQIQKKHSRNLLF